MKRSLRMMPALAVLVLTMAAARAELPSAVGDKYVVKAGDTLGALAKSFGMTLKALQLANPGIDADHLKVGQVIKVPAEAQGVMAGLGVDYSSLLHAAQTNKAALPLFMAQYDLLDCAPAEEFAADLAGLLQIHGDAAFAAALARFSVTMRQHLAREALYDGAPQPGETNVIAGKKRYPKTAALVISATAP